MSETSRGLALVTASAAVGTAMCLGLASVQHHPKPQPDWEAAERALLASELATAIGQDECIDPEDAPTLPRWVVVSWMTDGRMVSNTAERLPFGEAWALAEDGEAYVRCVIV